jgi:5-methylcytosine-specific restriction endonuclease McrA
MAIRHYRNPYIIEYVRRKANGICLDCNKPAPFVVRGTGEPYLEIHHIIPLASGGDDSIENTIALCPNCHRKRHYR